MRDIGTLPGAFVTIAPCCHTINNRDEVVGFSPPSVKSNIAGHPDLLSDHPCEPVVPAPTVDTTDGLQGKDAQRPIESTRLLDAELDRGTAGTLSAYPEDPR